MISKINRLEKMFIEIRNKNGDGSIVLKDLGGQLATLSDRLLTKKEVQKIKMECEQLNKQLIILTCWYN